MSVHTACYAESYHVTFFFSCDILLRPVEMLFNWFDNYIELYNILKPVIWQMSAS